MEYLCIKGSISKIYLGKGVPGKCRWEGPGYNYQKPKWKQRRSCTEADKGN